MAHVKKIFLLCAFVCIGALSFAGAKQETASESVSVPQKRTLVLLRHGQSTWNLENRFTGWSDVPLTETGIKGALDAGAALKDADIVFDVVHTSMLSRAIKTAWLTMESMENMWLPLEKHWRLNERCYGTLEGRTRSEVTDEVGKEQVTIWRRSYDVPPPPLSLDDPRSPVNNIRYMNIDKNLLPQSESLKDTIIRVRPYWSNTLMPALRAGKNVLVVGHSTCLRALSSCIQPELTPDELSSLEISNTTPIIYELEISGSTIKVISRTALKIK